MEVVNKKVLADKVAEENGITKKLASEVIDTLFATMTEALKDGKKVDIVDLDTVNPYFSLLRSFRMYSLSRMRILHKQGANRYPRCFTGF